MKNLISEKRNKADFGEYKPPFISDEEYFEAKQLEEAEVEYEAYIDHIQMNGDDLR